MKTFTKTLAAGIAAILLGFNVQAQTALSGDAAASNSCGTTAKDHTTAGNTAVGCGADAGTGGLNTVVGGTSGNSAMTGTANVCVGYSVGLAVTSGGNNTFVGAGSGVLHTLGSANTFLGAGAGLSNVGGSFSTFVGAGSGQTANSTSNTAVGYQAGFKSATSENVAIGVQALFKQNFAPTGGASTYNVAIGDDALYNNNPTTTSPLNGAYNTGVGHKALYTATTGTANTAQGYLAGGTNLTTGNNNTFIGYGADASSSGLNNGTAVGNGASICASNTMEFGNSSVVGWGFGSACPTTTEVFIVGTGITNGNGAYLSAGGTWTNVSDRDKKENIKEVEGQDILKKINLLSISSWNYKGEPNAPKHIGPMAQDFYKIFAVGNDNKSISTIDPAGVALAGIKEVSKETTSQAKEIESLKKQIAQLSDFVKAMGGINNTSNTTANRQAVQLTNANAVVLNQNVPNPFAEQTIINYSIPQTANVAQILFYDMAGQLIKTTDITTKGAGQLNVFANDLSNGNYSYTLVIDGKIIDTKKMVKQQ